MQNRRLARIGFVCGAALAALVGLLYAKGMHTARPVTTLVRGARVSSARRRLVVFVKGGSADLTTYKPLLGRLLAEPELAGSDLLLFDHRLGRLTIGHDYDFATRLRAEIDAQWIRNGGYDDVILAGHSTGSLLLRAAYLQAAGRDPRQPRTVPWSDHVSRIVLLAGIGRGVDAEFRGRWQWVLAVGRFIPFVRRSVMYDVLRGADFVTDVRISWIRHFAELSKNANSDPSAPRPPTVVQLLGTEDDVLRRDDNVDLEQFPTAFHVDVPGAGHQTLHRFELTPDPELTYTLFRDAFVNAVPSHAAPRRPPPADPVRRVVLLLHGLRSSRDEWVHELAPELRRRLPNAEIVESSYGWISMLGFVLPSVRRRELRWLQDQYSEYLARHPDAVFDVVAHSNGAYLVGEALERIPSMRFDRVVLMGSVLPADYGWNQRRAWGQTHVIRTERAADDMVVAVLCNALRGLGMTDVGTSGWSGFQSGGAADTEIVWRHGGHSAALAPANLIDVAEFLGDGHPSSPVPARPAVTPDRSVAIISQLAPWFARLTLFAIAILLARSLWRTPGRRQRLAFAAAAALIVMIVLDVV